MFPPHRLQRLLLGMVSALVLAATGCGTRTYPVTGIVVWEDGTPAKELASGGVHFTSEEMKLSTEAEIGPDGRFQAKLYRETGLPAGEYQVIVTPPEDPGREEPGRARAAIDPRFRQYETSGLKATVEPKDNDFTFKVERAKR